MNIHDSHHVGWFSVFTKDDFIDCNVYKRLFLTTDYQLCYCLATVCAYHNKSNSPNKAEIDYSTWANWMFVST